MKSYQSASSACLKGGVAAREREREICMEEGVVDVLGAEGETDCRCGGGLRGPQGGR